MPQLKKQLKKQFKQVWEIIKDTFRGFGEDNAIKLSASLSYYTIFSLPPLLIVIISLCSIVFGEDAVEGEIFGQIRGLIGSKAAQQIQEILKNTTLNNENVPAAIISIATLLLGASGVFGEIQSSINLIWGLKAKPKKGFIKFIKNRLMSFSMVGAMGFLFMVSLFINALMDVLHNRLKAQFPDIAVSVFYIVNVLLIFIFITGLFVVVFRTLPDGKMALKDTLVGASVTAVLFMGGKFAIGAYLGQSDLAGTYGAAASLVLILVWVYYSAMILYFGAELTKAYTFARGHKISPKPYAVTFTKPHENAK
jgi:membrane protein